MTFKMQLDIINSKFVKIKEYTLNTSGQYNNIIFVNGEWVFRIPKYLPEITVLKRTAEQLDVLSELLPLPIPKYSFQNLDTNVVGEAMVGYRKLSGNPLSRESFNQIGDKNHIANQLGTFLKTLHSIPTIELNNLSIPETDNYSFWLTMYEEIQTLLFKYLRDDAVREIRKNFDTFLNNKENRHFESTLIHDDFGPTNILSDGNEITGIIDFDSLTVNDPAIDIASLMGKFGYGESFVLSMEPVYPGVQKLVERARFYRSTFALQDALFGVKNDDEESFEDGIRDYI